MPDEIHTCRFRSIQSVDFVRFPGRRSIFSLLDGDSVKVSAPIKMIVFGTVNPQARVREQRKCGCTTSESRNSS